MEKYIIVSKEEAIKRILDMPNDTLFMFSFNCEKNGISDEGKYIDKEQGKEIVCKAKTRILSGNQYMSQLNLYSAFYPDIYKINPRGIIDTILLGKCE